MKRKPRYKLYLRATSYFNPDPDKIHDVFYRDYADLESLMRKANQFIKLDNVYDVGYLILQTGEFVNLKGRYL
jgi:hypothetical protein